MGVIKHMSALALSPLRTGSPDTTMYASPIVSTLYTSYVSILSSNVVYKSFNRLTTCSTKVSLISKMKVLI